MLTTKDYMEYKARVTSEVQTLCDKWLQNVVFPKFTGNGCGFDCPSFASLVDMESMLKQRGWEVTSYSSFHGTVLYLTLPPQGE